VLEAAPYVYPWVGMTVEALPDREGRQPNRSLAKDEMLLHESFPHHKTAQYDEHPPTGSALIRVTEYAVEQSLYSQSVKNALEPNKLSFGTIQQLCKWDKEMIVTLRRAAIHTGRHPAAWKRASGVVIRKPGKDDYTKPKAHHSILLLSCTGKVIQKPAVQLLS